MHGAHPFVVIDENSSTRERILAVAFEEMYEQGYQGLRIDRVLEKTQLTKGALYHHFRSKKELGYAIVDEILQDWIKTVWSFDTNNDDPIASCKSALRNYFSAMTDEDFARGCPINNLAQEMAGLDDGFQSRLFTIYSQWKEFTEEFLSEGQQRSKIRPDINTQAVSTFIICSIQGLIGMAKCSKCNEQDLAPIVEELCRYLDTLRA